VRASVADGIQLRLDEALAGMHLARLHQAPPALHALRVAPEVADMVGKGRVHHLVVGIADDPARRIDEGRVVGIGQPPCQRFSGRQPGAGMPPLALVRGVAGGHRAHQLHRDARAVGQRQVLRRGHEELARRDRLVDAAPASAASPPSSWCRGRQRRPGTDTTWPAA
jgi:hypothetical protein